jgi:hypothetical protein
LRHRAEQLQANLGGLGLSRLQVIGVMSITAPEIHRSRVSPAGKEPALPADGLDGELAFLFLDVHRHRSAARPGKRHQVHVVAFFEGHPLPVGRGHRFLGVKKREVHPPIASVQLHRDELGDFLVAALFLHALLVGIKKTPFRAKGGLNDLAARGEGAAGVEGSVGPDDELRRASFGGNAHQVVPEIIGPGPSPGRGARASRRHQELSVRAPHRVNVLARLRGESFGRRRASPSRDVLPCRPSS